MSEASEKIKKLLALSSSPNENEAKAALMKAQEIALSTGIDISKLDVEDDKYSVEPLIDDVMGRRPMYLHYLIHALCKNFRVEAIWACGVDRTTFRTVYQLNVVGKKNDIEIFKQVFHYTLAFYKRSWELFFEKYKSTYHLTTTYGPIKNDYTFGFCIGLETAFKRNIEEHALVLVNNPRIRDFIDKEMRAERQEAQKPDTAGSHVAFGVGKKDGIDSASSRQIETDDLSVMKMLQ